MSLTRSALLGLAGATVLAAGRAAAQPEARMHQRKIPSSDEMLPVVGVGTWRTFDVGARPANRAPLAEVLRLLFDAGGSAIDTSPMYGSAEAVVGDLLSAANSRAKAFIATKVWTTGRDNGLTQMRNSLRLLKTDRIDLMQIHNLVDWRAHLPTLQAWKAEGRIRYLGITHYTQSAHDELESVMRSEKWDFVQVNYALDDRAVERTLLPLATERGIAVIVNQPFGGGGLLRKLLSRKLPEWAAEIGATSWAQLLLKFVLANPAVTCVIPGTGKPEHMADNLRAGFGVYPDATLLKRMIAEIDV
ncbi:aldo/keto reductase [Reyranella sp.]|uniref:aldo/keto reductase n=1 Tax=Reyranella sp. TaxID=1929291 RepID=UPI002613370A|nr:aldo/keto reductase [Reyranella sp.]HQS16815.1 aldo/keto reductase [Reyranella sp.]HQT12700.1 aldo/keto reductase [Reyranella sp.]